MVIGLATVLLLLAAGDARAGLYRVAQCGWGVGAELDPTYPATEGTAFRVELLYAGLFALTNIIAAQGALPIKVGEDVIGAAGVSGAPGGDKDEACVKAGLDKVADQLK